MNNTKWKEIINQFWKLECSDQYAYINVPYSIRTTDGYETEMDSTWSHFDVDNYKAIDRLCLYLSNENKTLILDILRTIHVPGEIKDNVAYIYGYRTDVEYIK